MKLLMISGDRSLAQGKRGAFWYTLEELSKHWERVDVICPGSPHPLTPSPATGDGGKQSPLSPVPGERGRGFEGLHSAIFLHPSPHALWQQPFWIAKKGRELIAAHQHDVMTVHEYPPFYNGLGAWMLHRTTGIPYALEIHHVVGYPIASSLSERIGYALSRLFLRLDAKCASRVRTVNQSTASLLGSWGIPPSKLHVVPSFYLDASLLAPDSSIEKKWDVAFCARLVSNKGLWEVLSAVESIPGCRLLVIGDGPLRLSLERRAETLGIQDRVRFAGWLPNQEEVIRAVQSAKIFVMNSRSEGGPRSALEAMACGMPVIATRVGVMPDVIKDGSVESGKWTPLRQGYEGQEVESDANGLWTTGDALDVAQKISVLLESPDMREQMGRNATKVVEKFEKETLIRGYAEFLKGLSGRSSLTANR